MCVPPPPPYHQNKKKNIQTGKLTGLVQVWKWKTRLLLILLGWQAAWGHTSLLLLGLSA